MPNDIGLVVVVCIDHLLALVEAVGAYVVATARFT
jgi:hypothetical protein